MIDSFLTGSYRRNTMIATLSDADIDMCIVLNPSEYNKDKPKLSLDKVKKVLENCYPITKIRRDGQAITIKFNDFNVYVVPSFECVSGRYLIPNSCRCSRISTTNPKLRRLYIGTERFMLQNVSADYKQIKCWKRYNEFALKSFYLELMTADIFRSMEIPCDSFGIRYFFDRGREGIK